MSVLEQTIENKYLSKTKIIKASTSYELNIKIAEQKTKWKAEEVRQRERERLVHLELDAEIQNQELTQLLSSYGKILADILNTPSSFNWNDFLDTRSFPSFSFPYTKPTQEFFIQQFNVPSESFLEAIFPWIRDRRLSLLEKATNAYDAACLSYDKDKADALTLHNTKKEVYYSEQQNKNAPFIELKKSYYNGKSKGIEFLCERILNELLSNIPLKKEFQLQYQEDTQILILDYRFPSPDNLP
ncbi:MAG: hypothetical protein Q4F66_07570, partial [Clostridium sp.]|nr:hypothetical protein [Clostridium sp.]